MSRCLIRLLAVLVAALAAIFSPLSTNAAMDERRSDCCEHTTHQTDHCSDCLVCATGLSCVLPGSALFWPDAGIVVAQLDRQAFTAETRNEPPPLPPPRLAA